MGRDCVAILFEACQTNILMIRFELRSVPSREGKQSFAADARFVLAQSKKTDDEAMIQNSSLNAAGEYGRVSAGDVEGDLSKN